MTNHSPAAPASAEGGKRRFPVTHWSVVLAAGGAPSVDSSAALEKLCATYWYPIYGEVRRLGRGVHDAQDLTQSFFAHLLEGARLGRVHPAKGKFRSFLLVALRNFLNNEYDRDHALKRGRQFKWVSIDENEGEERFQRELAHPVTPERAYEQRWAMTILDGIVQALRDEYAREGKADVFDRLQPYIGGDRGGVPYAEVARSLGVSESAVKMAVRRLRRRLGERIRAEVAKTVGTPEEVDEEIRCLFSAVAG